MHIDDFPKKKKYPILSALTSRVRNNQRIRMRAVVYTLLGF